MNVSLLPSTSIAHVLKAKKVDDKNELVTLRFNGIELNTIIFGQGLSGGKPKRYFCGNKLKIKGDILGKLIFEKLLINIRKHITQKAFIHHK